MRKNIFKIVLLVAFILAWLAVYRLNLISYLSFTNLKTQQTSIIDIVQNNRIISFIIFSMIYILTTALSLPGATILTLTGGLIFGIFWGTIIVVISATIGASLAFFSSRFILGEWVINKYEKQLNIFNQGLTENGFNYLLFLRLVPLFPFFLINLVMGLTKISVRNFVLASLIGMVPGSFVYCNAGTQLGSISSLNDLSSPRLLFSFALLGCLALVPLIYKKLKGK